MAGKAVAQETVFALRETIARMEGKDIRAFDGSGDRAKQIAAVQDKRERLSFGIDVLDQALEGGLPLDGLAEIRTSAMKDAGAASGFALAVSALLQNQGEGPGQSMTCGLPILWIADRLAVLETGMPYALGLLDFGIKPETFLHARPRRLEDALWLAEAAAASGAFAITVLEVCGNLKHFGLTESRRLSLRAKASGRPLFVLRQAGEEEASSADFRFLVETAPAANRYLADGTMLGGSIGHSVFRLTLERSRNPAPFSLLLEWNSDDRRLSTAHAPAKSVFAVRHPTYSGPDFPKTVDRSGAAAKVGARLAFDRAS
ncbi:ImuA family protein [Rhizobium panacihumi]|uniref:ImuA family protein n=1 Tax=Rhizobium panacihumi TaxID=2008450 RepID=UPI003D7A2377